jgi:hypothetical protein
LLDLVSENTNNWDLNKGKIITIDYGYDCVKKFYTSDVFEELSSLYSIDSHVLLEVVKPFAKYVVLPKEGFIEYVKPMKYPAIMPTRIDTSQTYLYFLMLHACSYTHLLSVLLHFVPFLCIFRN